MAEFWHAVSRHYRHDIIDDGKQPQFFLLIAFLLTFLIVRFITHSIRNQRFPFLRNVSMGGTHIHHLIWGILLLLTTGYIAIALDPRGRREELAVLFGIGSALTLDEFALWLRLQDVYWTREGRRSIDAVVVTTTVALLILLGRQFWIDIARDLGDLVGLR